MQTANVDHVQGAGTSPAPCSKRRPEADAPPVLTPVQLKYLLTIYVLRHDGEVRSIRVAQALHVTRPSVHKMVAQLEKLGLLDRQRYATVRMSARGLSLAQRYHAAYVALVQGMCEQMGLPEGLAREGAFLLLCGYSEQQREDVCAHLTRHPPAPRA